MVSIRATVVTTWALIKPYWTLLSYRLVRACEHRFGCFSARLGTKMVHMNAPADPGTSGIDDAAREEKDIDVALGAEVRGLRSKRGLSQEQLGALSGIGKRTLIRLEAGERAMSMPQLYKICIALGIKPSTLINAMESELGIQ